jgi:putative ABC transport system ATP-binding protein
MMLTITNVSKSFRSGDGQVHAVRDVSLAVPTGCFAAVIGRSGSGKSTLLSLMGALDKPTSGRIELDGQAITGSSDRELIRYRRHMIGFVFQSFNLVPNLTAGENVMLPMEFAGVPSAARTARARELLDQVSLLGDKQDRRPTRLSGGEQQRVAVARALANRPRLVLADEPTGNLDSRTGNEIVALLRELARSEATTIVIVTHDPGIARAADLVFELEDGHLEGTPVLSGPPVASR